MATRKKDVVKKEESVPGLATPSFLTRGKRRGQEGLKDKDFEIPRVGILQALSPQIEDGHRAGFMYHNLLDECLFDEEGSNVLSVIPIMNRVRFVLWNPRHMGGGRLATAEDGVHWDVPNQEFEVQPLKDDKSYKTTWRIGKTVDELTMCPDENGNFTKSIADFGTLDPRPVEAGGKLSAPAATMSYNFLFRAHKYFHLGPFIVIVQKTSEKAGKILNASIALQDVDSFGQIYRMGGEYISNAADEKFWRYQFKFDRLMNEDEAELYHICENDYENFQKLDRWKIRDEEADLRQAEASQEASGAAASRETSDEM